MSTLVQFDALAVSFVCRTNFFQFFAPYYSDQGEIRHIYISICAAMQVYDFKTMTVWKCLLGFTVTRQYC